MRVIITTIKAVSDIYKIFIDNIGIKRFKSDYNIKKILPDIRQYILKYIINIDKVFFEFKYIRVTMAALKS